MSDQALTTMDLSQALLLPFVAGFVVQRLLELLDPITAGWLKDSNKKIVLALASAAIGWTFAYAGHMQIFSALHQSMPDYLDKFFTGIFISAGTEGFNSLLKFASYKKEASKAEAADKKSKMTQEQLASVNP